jgi:hypothetical protein
MAVEAPISKFKKSNLKIYIVLCICLAGWCIYDGYFNEGWIERHTNADGSRQAYLVVNRNAPPYLIGAAVVLAVYLFVIRNKKIIAGENELIIGDKVKIPYDSIQQIDKTRFKSKGIFIIMHKNDQGRDVERKISDRTYDNLEALLDELVARIS